MSEPPGIAFTLADRVEKLCLALEIDNRGYKDFKEGIDQIAGHEFDIMEGDTLKLNYALSIEYFGKVAENLKTIIDLREAGYKTEINMTEANHGRCLIAEVLMHVDTILESE